MPIPYDPNDTEGAFELPELGVPVAIHIGQNEEKTSSNGNPMIVMETKVADGQTGAGFGCKFYLVKGRMFNYNVKRIKESCGMDTERPDTIDDMTFRDRLAVVEFQQEEYTNRDGEQKKATKIARWLPAEKMPKLDMETDHEDDPLPF